jgi:hypothetical protein
MSLPPFVDRDYVIPDKVGQEDAQELKQYLMSVYSRRDAKQTVNNLESRGRLEKGVHDNLQALLDMADVSEFMFVGGKRKNRSRRKSRVSK